MYTRLEGGSVLYATYLNKDPKDQKIHIQIGHALQSGEHRMYACTGRFPKQITRAVARAQVSGVEPQIDLYSWLYQKGYFVSTTFNSYVAHTKRFANRNSLAMAPPLACRALTMVKFPTKNGDDGLHCRDQFLNCSAILSAQSPLNNLVYRLGRLHSRAKKNYTNLLLIHNNQPMRMTLLMSQREAMGASMVVGGHQPPEGSS